MVKKWSACSVFLIVMVIMVTPSFAVSMEDVAQAAHKYNQEQYNKSFLVKINLLVKGFKLLAQATKAKIDGEKDTSLEGEQYSSDEKFFEYEAQKRAQKKELLDYLKSKNISNNNTFANNQTSNGTNGLVGTNSSNRDPSKCCLTPPQYCLTHVENIVKALLEKGIETSYVQTNSVDSLICGNIVQMIDNRGNVHYAQIVNLTNDTVIVNTGNSIRKYVLDEFQKHFTGIIIQTNNNITLNNVIDAEKSILNQEGKMAQYTHDKARNHVTVWSVFISVAITLLIVGVILTIFSATRLIKAAEQGSRFTARFISKNAEEEFLAIANKDIEQIPGRPPMDSATALKKVIHNFNILNNPDVKWGGTPPEKVVEILTNSYMESGVEISALTGIQLALAVACQNWVRVISCTIGLILVLFGIGLLIRGITQTIRNGKGWHYSNTILGENKQDSCGLREWVNYNDTLNTTVN